MGEYTNYYAKGVAVRRTSHVNNTVQSKSSRESGSRPLPASCSFSLFHANNDKLHGIGLGTRLSKWHALLNHRLTEKHSILTAPQAREQQAQEHLPVDISQQPL